MPKFEWLLDWLHKDWISVVWNWCFLFQIRMKKTFRYKPNVQNPNRFHIQNLNKKDVEHLESEQLEPVSYIWGMCFTLSKKSQRNPCKIKSRGVITIAHNNPNLVVLYRQNMDHYSTRLKHKKNLILVQSSQYIANTVNVWNPN